MGETSHGELSVVDVSHAYDRGTKGNALNNASFTIPAGEFWTLLGPSGSGKSTLLGIIGGYIRCTEGRVLLDARDITDLPPRQRDIGMVFQDYALFPHMTVFENVAYGLRARRLDRREIHARVGRMIELNRLTGFEQRYPHQLSGGQQQRVALARALVIQPRALLMDEALGALDLKLRESMQVEIRRIQREMAITTIHVTHDQAEALTMSDRIVIVRNGAIEQIDTPDALQSRPTNRFVAKFVGFNNVLPVTIASLSHEAVRGTISGISGERVLCKCSIDVGAGSGWSLVLRPEDVEVTSDSVPSGVPGTIVATKYLGMSRCFVVEIGRGIDITASDRSGRGGIGDRVQVSWRPDRAFLVSDRPAACAPAEHTRAVEVQMQ